MTDGKSDASPEAVAAMPELVRRITLLREIAHQAHHALDDGEEREDCINHAKFTALIAELMKERAEAKAAGLAEGLARAAEIARGRADGFAGRSDSFFNGRIVADELRRIAEAILSASPPDLTLKEGK